MMNNKKRTILRALSLLLAVLALASALTACKDATSAPDGYQYATCSGEYFRLFVPEGWQVNTESGVSGAYLNPTTHVTLEEVYFLPQDMDEATADDPMKDLPDGLRAFATHHVAEVSKLQSYKSQKAMANTLGGHSAWDITYEAKVGTQMYGFRQVLTMTEIEGKQHFYVFTYTALLEQTFEQWLDQVEGMMKEVVFESFPYEGEYVRKIPEDANTPEGMQRVSTDEVVYRFYAPKSWIVDKDNGNCLVYASETDRSNVSVMSYLPSGRDGISVEEYWQACRTEYENTPAIENFTVQSESAEEKLGGGQSLCYEFTYTLGGVNYKCRQIMAAYRGMIYIMTYTATVDLYDSHMEEVKTMQNAIVFA